jgi:hypothetical protein
MGFVLMLVFVGIIYNSQRGKEPKDIGYVNPMNREGSLTHTQAQKFTCIYEIEYVVHLIRFEILSPYCLLISTQLFMS